MLITLKLKFESNYSARFLHWHKSVTFKKIAAGHLFQLLLKAK